VYTVDVKKHLAAVALAVASLAGTVACEPKPAAPIYPAWDFPIPNPIEIINSIIREVRNAAGQLVPKTFMKTRVQIRTGPTTKRTEDWSCRVVMAFPTDSLGHFTYWPKDPNWNRTPFHREMWNKRCGETARSSGAALEAGVFDRRYPLVYWVGNRVTQPYYPVQLNTLLDPDTGRGIGTILNVSIGTRPDLWTDYYFVAFVSRTAQ
jgi:hypothetical protein